MHSYALCGFCDASTTADAAVVYLVMETQGDVHTPFIVAKIKVAPMQTLTIPRLELFSALLLSRLITTVSAALKSALPDLKIRCYIDQPWPCIGSREPARNEKSSSTTVSMRFARGQPQPSGITALVSQILQTSLPGE